jgi:hypothetical protein
VAERFCLAPRKQPFAGWSVEGYRSTRFVMIKILLWAVVIIFIIGLLVTTGVIKLLIPG